MAITQDEALGQIQAIVDADNNTDIKALDTNTATSGFFATFKRFCATILVFFSEEYDRQSLALSEIVQSQIIGSRQWYKDKALAFQEGDPLVVIDGEPQYATVDDSKKVVKHVSVIDRTLTDEGGTGLYLKVAKGEATSRMPLSSEELAKFKEYIDDVGLAGISIIAESRNADLLKLGLTLTLDRRVFTLTNEIAGSPGFYSSSTPNEFTSEINKYLQGLEFDSILFVDKLVDVLQAISGVVSVHVDSVSATPDRGTEVSITDGRYESKSGYMKLDVGGFVKRLRYKGRDT